MVRMLCVLLSLASTVIAQAQTPFPVRNVVSGQVETVPKGDYLLTVQCNIQPGGKLVIDAGASIKVDGPGIVFNNRGVLEINGTELDPVRVYADAGKNCGTLFCPWTSGPRPQLLVSHLNWTSTVNANCFFLQATDFSISNSTITNRAVTTAANRVCLAINSGSSGVLSACYLDGCSPDVPKASVGVLIGNGTVQTDEIQFVETVIADTTEPVRIRKRYASISGLVQ